MSEEAAALLEVSFRSCLQNLQVWPDLQGDDIAAFWLTQAVQYTHCDVWINHAKLVPLRQFCIDLHWH